MMFGYEMIRESKPCLYEILFRQSTVPTMVLRLNEAFVEANKDLVPLGPFAGNRTYDVGVFQPLREEYFGYGQFIRKFGIKDGFVEFEIKIPTVVKISGEPCPHCQGTGHKRCWCVTDTGPDKDCFSCDGTGYELRPCSWCDGRKLERKYDWSESYALVASLQLLFQMLDMFDEPFTSPAKQLFTVQLYCGEGQGHFPIGGSYGIEFCEWLSSVERNYFVFEEAIEAMRMVYEHAFQEKRGFPSYDFQAYVEKDAWLIINCPGDACGIFPEHSRKPGKGVEYSCHNMDSPLQQLMLLAALAIIGEMAKKKISEVII